MDRRPDDQDLFRPAPLPVAELDDAGRLACLRLLRSANVGPVAFRELINHYGGAAQALAALPHIAGRGPLGRKLEICPTERAERELDQALKIGATPLFTIEPGYPAALALTEQPPPLIYVKGRTQLLNTAMLAIVGSRKASAAGLKLTRQFAGELAGRGLTIVSGLARGIDANAHQAALSHATIAVVAGGVDIVYPPEHDGLQSAIGKDGCLVSEMPPGFRPRANDFPRRNRIIAGLSHAVLVIEAARRSGTLSTARYAADFGRDVFAVPGHPLDPRAAGTNALLKQGATLVVEPNDVIESLQTMTGALRPPAGAAEYPSEFEPAPAANIPAAPHGQHETQAVLDALGPQPIEVDELARATGLPIRTIRIILLECDLNGLIDRHGSQLVSLRPCR